MKNNKRFSSGNFLSILLFLIMGSLVAYGGIYVDSNKAAMVIQPEKIEVIIKNNTFSPDTARVPLNVLITWINEDSVSHSVTSNSDAFDSQKINVKSTFEYQFSVADTFRYHCKDHPEMKGIVIVK